MAFFDDFTDALKQKWLDYYRDNRSWFHLGRDERTRAQARTVNVAVFAAEF